LSFLYNLMLLKYKRMRHQDVSACWRRGCHKSREGLERCK